MRPSRGFSSTACLASSPLTAIPRSLASPAFHAASIRKLSALASPPAARRQCATSASPMAALQPGAAIVAATASLAAALGALNVRIR